MFFMLFAFTFFLIDVLWKTIFTNVLFPSIKTHIFHHHQPFFTSLFFHVVVWKVQRFVSHVFASNVSSLLFVFTFFIVVSLNSFSFLVFLIFLFCSSTFFFHQQKLICFTIINFFVLCFFLLLLFKRCKVCLSFFLPPMFFFYSMGSLSLLLLFTTCYAFLLLVSFLFGLFVVFRILLVAFQFWIQYQKYRFLLCGKLQHSFFFFQGFWLLLFF
jgi:hypothetical protein